MPTSSPGHMGGPPGHMAPGHIMDAYLLSHQLCCPFSVIIPDGSCDLNNITIWVSFRENEPSLYIYGIVSAKRDLVHIIKFVIKMPYV